MAIPASHIVEIAPRVITGGSNDLVFNGLLLSHNPLISAGALVLSFPSAAAVGEYFGTESEEYTAAEVYFTSYDNKFAAPEALLIARRVEDDIPAWLRGGSLTVSLAALKRVSDGSLVLGIDNVAVSVSSVDFSGITSYSEAGERLQSALEAIVPGVRVSYSSLTSAFTITSPSVGSVSAMDYAAAGVSGTDLAALFNLTEGEGAVLSPGMDALSVTEQMEAVTKVTQNFVSFTTLEEVDEEDLLAYAGWASNHFGWLYVAHTTDARTPVAESGTDPASLLVQAGYDHTTIIYGTLGYAAFIMGSVASVPWGRVNGTVTFAFKSQSGLAAWAVDEQTATVLESKRCNYFGDFSTRNADFVFMYPACLSASDYGCIDPYINAVWLNNRLQVAIMDGLKSSGRVPYNHRGYTMIRAWMMDPINQARVNAAIESGVELSERQKSELYSEAGRNIADELWTQGYCIQIQDPGAAVRAKRGSPIVSLWYTYAGAIHRVEVASTAVL